MTTPSDDAETIEDAPAPTAVAARPPALTTPVTDTVSTGFPSLDHLLGGGPRRGDVVILGGDVSVGKSSLALAIARRSSEAGHSVALLSGEMTVKRLGERIEAFEGRQRIDDLRHAKANVLHLLDGTGAPAPALRPVLAELPDHGVAGVSDFLVEHLGIDLVIVDPLQYLAVGERVLDEELAAAARALKELALRRQTTILAVAQLARSVRERPDPRPVLDDFGGRGAITQHADVVLALFREELYAPSVHTEGASELHVLKNRNGPRGFVDLYFYKQWLRFEDMVDPDR